MKMTNSFNIEEFSPKPLKKLRLNQKLSNSKIWFKKSFQKKIQRNNNLVYENYQKSWEKYLIEKSWLKFSNLSDYCFPNNKNNVNFNRMILYKNNLYEVSMKNWNRINVLIKLTYLQKFLTTESIVELGCGIGRNIFGFYSLGLKNKIEGYEYTEYGLKVCQAIKDHFRLDIRLDRVDLKNNLGSINLEGKTVFTSHVLEQLKYDTESVILNIINERPKQIIHFEPCVELAKNDYFGNLFKKHIKRNDYQETLFYTIKKLEMENKLKIMEVIPNYFAMNYVNQTSVIRYEVI